jgi:predicted nucleic acid-binding protein
MHPFVLGEIACGNLRDRRQTLQLLSSLPGAAKAFDDEVLTFIESRSLMGKGIGLIDAHLLASVALTGDATIWTRDRRLQREAQKLELASTPDA